ncbi:MAG: protein translocase subunit SecD [Deltaproteobacteria bacterium]|nr:protein translocase subunit SecD [Deltaproteobacteria bacterium]MDQ3300050.1 protein translocase subunit SecD [Myxococcota bacterium]
MDRSLKWRTIILLVITLGCVGILTPNFVEKDQLPSWFPFKDTRLSMGLDLQGGTHIVYSIDLDKAVDDRSSEIKRDLESRFADDATMKQKPVVKTPPTPIGAVTVIMPDAASRGAIEGQVKSDYGETVETRDCPAADGPNAYCFRVSSGYADGIKKAALSNAVNTIRERIDEKGIAEPSVVQKGDEIIVELPGLDEEKKQQTRDIIARTAKLEFKVVDDGSAFMNKLYAHVGSEGKEGKPTEARAIRDDIYAEIDQWRPDDGGTLHTDYFLIARDRRESLTIEDAKKIDCVNRAGRPNDPDVKVEAGRVMCNVNGRQVIARYLEDLAKTDPSFQVPDDRQIAYELVEPQEDATDKRPFWRTYYLDRAVRLTGTSISDATGNYDPNTNRPIVLLDFNRYGGRVFGDLTAEIAGKKLATILDDKVKSAPIINGAIRGGRASITMGGGNPQRQEAERDELVNVLKTGSLPAPLKEESVSDVGPTLGRDAVEKTKFSFALGCVLVILIMIGIYKWSGVIAVVMVMFFVTITMSIMALFGATLTLPGIAAIVLSVGMTVDGNILIFERIRDELLLGKSVRGAVDLGFARAFSAILDGQLTTAAAGWVLLQYGSGPIKGFAVMLLVGVFTTLFTNIWISRIFFDWYIAKKKSQLSTISI